MSSVSESISEVFPDSGAMRTLRILPEISRARHIMLFRGAHSFEASGAGEAFRQCVPQQARVTEFVVSAANPKWESVRRAASCLLTKEWDIVVAVGGGSVMDTAKAALVSSKKPDATLTELCRAPVVTNFARPALILVPTTPGTGSECTPFATVYLDEVKYSVDCSAVMPGRILLDPLLLRSLPQTQVVFCVLDAVCQAIESLWAMKRTELSSSYAWRALETLKPVLATLRDGKSWKSLETTSRMLLGGHYSGRAIAISRTTAPHAFSYALTIQHDIPHGHAVAVMMLAVLRYHALVGAVGTSGIETQVANQLFDTSNATLAALWKGLLIDLHVPCNLSALGIPSDAVVKLVSMVDASRVSNHPEQIDTDRFRSLLEG